MSAHPHTHGSDLKAGIAGFLIGVVALTVLVYGMVKWTNSHYEGKSGAAATTTTGH